jgi:hypothetical protein
MNCARLAGGQQSRRRHIRGPPEVSLHHLKSSSLGPSVDEASFLATPPEEAAATHLDPNDKNGDNDNDDQFDAHAASSRLVRRLSVFMTPLCPGCVAATSPVGQIYDSVKG